MEWQVLTMVVIACAFSGCVSQPFKEDAKVDVKGRQIATKPETLTGELSEGSLQNFFDGIWGTIHPEREMEQNLEQLLRLYYRSEHQLRVFDAELDQRLHESRSHTHLLAEMDSYAPMLAYRELTFRAMLRISYVYDRLHEIRAESERESSDYKRAELALHSFHLFFQHAKGADRLALHDLSAELKKVFDRYAAQEKAPRVKIAPHPFRNTLFEENEKLVDFARKTEVQEELSQKSLLLNSMEGDETESEFQKNLGDQHAAFQQELMPLTNSNSNREPQAEALRFYPSSGPHGSISGVEYPKGTWSLTFDDGPSTKYTPMVLKNLKEHDLHSTFFELATNVDSDKKTSLSVLNAGMEMANHSYTHPQLPKQDDAHLKHEVVDSTRVEVKVWGEDHRPKLFRCPYGAGLTVKRVREMIASQGFVHVFWNVDTLDWQDKNPESIVARAKKEMAIEGGGIILFHDIHPQSVEASRMVMDWIKQKGYRHMRVGDEVKELNDKFKRETQANPATQAK
jgi:peptidoglycan/xylan/chitin deacetylase (PgdA/CDA1 family)